MRIATATRPDPNSLSIPAAVRSTWIRELSLVACPAASNSASRPARSSRSIAVTGCICAWRVKPCRPKCSGSNLIIDLNLCLWSPAFPVPPRPPAPRPCFLPRPCVRLPRSLRVLLGIRRLLHDHPHDERVDRFSPVPEVSSVVVPALDSAVALPRRRQSDHRTQVADVRDPRLSFDEGLTEIPDGLVWAVGFHERVVDRPVSDLSTAFQQELREDLGIDRPPGHVVLDELEHPAIGGILRHDRAVVLPCEMQEPKGVLHLAAKVALASEAQDRETHFSVSVSSVATSSPSLASVRSSPSTSTSSGRASPSAAGAAGAAGAAATLRMNTCSAPDLIFNRSVCSVRTLRRAVRRRAPNVASA